jgi:hypothetical protein
LSRLEYLKHILCTSIKDVLEEWDLVLALFIISFVFMFFGTIYLT